MADLNVKSETIDKAIDIISESTKESRTALDSNTSKGINKFFELLKSTPIGIRLDTYIAERPYKLEKAMNEMKSKYKQIPENNRVEPSSYIALQTVNNLNYALDEDYLKDMFISILISDMDARKKTRVKPAYIEMVKQLSREDTNFLKMLKENNLTQAMPIIQVKWSFNDGGFVNFEDKILINPNNKKTTIIDSIVLNNLLRLQILSIPNGVFLMNCKDCYNYAFEEVKKGNLFNIQSIVQSDMKLDFNKEKLELTPLGKEIIDICLS